MVRQKRCHEPTRSSLVTVVQEHTPRLLLRLAHVTISYIPSTWFPAAARSRRPSGAAIKALSCMAPVGLHLGHITAVQRQRQWLTIESSQLSIVTESKVSGRHSCDFGCEAIDEGAHVGRVTHQQVFSSLSTISPPTKTLVLTFPASVDRISILETCLTPAPPQTTPHLPPPSRSPRQMVSGLTTVAG